MASGVDAVFAASMASGVDAVVAVSFVLCPTFATWKLVVGCGQGLSGDCCEVGGCLPPTLRRATIGQGPE